MLSSAVLLQSSFASLSQLLCKNHSRNFGKHDLAQHNHYQENLVSAYFSHILNSTFYNHEQILYIYSTQIFVGSGLASIYWQ